MGTETRAGDIGVQTGGPVFAEEDLRIVKMDVATKMGRFLTISGTAVEHNVRLSQHYEKAKYYSLYPVGIPPAGNGSRTWNLEDTVPAEWPVMAVILGGGKNYKVKAPYTGGGTARTGMTLRAANAGACQMLPLNIGAGSPNYLGGTLMSDYACAIYDGVYNSHTLVSGTASGHEHMENVRLL